MEKITLDRTGDKKLTFKGYKIAYSYGNNRENHNETRFYSGFLYLSNTNKFIAHARYTTLWQGESSTDTVAIFENIENAADWLTERLAPNQASDIFDQLNIVETV